MNRKILRQTLKKKKLIQKEMILFNYFEQTKIQENFLRNKLFNHRNEMPPLEVFPHTTLTKRIEEFVKIRCINKELKGKTQMEFFNGSSSKNNKNLNDDSITEPNEMRSKSRLNLFREEFTEARLNQNEEKKIKSLTYSKKIINRLSEGIVQKDANEEEIRGKSNEIEMSEDIHKKPKKKLLLRTTNNFSTDRQEYKDPKTIFIKKDFYSKDVEKDSTSNEYQFTQKSMSKEKNDFLESYFSESNLKKKAIISSKHNMFRLKPQNALALKYSYKEFN